MDIQLMIERIFGFLGELGLFGLFTAIFLEGASVPFPGIVVVLAYGGLLNMSFAGMAGIAAIMAVIYSLASLIPYFIGNKLEHLIRPNIRKGLDKASRIFNRYGIWSIALSRPFGIGNYISYMAGISGVGLLKYLLLTFAGILPWCFAILYLGDYLNGNYDRFLELFDEYKMEFYGTGLLLAILFTVYSIWKRRKNEHR
ncbi:VTT domain-containing protein [Planococcus sp. ISL-109]|uniref:DedA family protein n=1 Tax=Planococcus sp. ISL-109 TaxID=2819166 RepID=UPI001BE93B54|nr:VTT domain-containing protein [Planococcus sp. ISL-109]MBT2582884.1 VTT domain-containing protein [Planococcus sp. ISL-109]